MSLERSPAVADRRRLERAVVMHGTSRYRERLARMLAKLLHESGAAAVAYGWTDGLAPHLLSPVHVVTSRPGVRWDLTLPASHAVSIDRDAPFAWHLVLVGATPDRLEGLESAIDFLRGYLAEAADRDVPTMPEEERGDALAFLELLGAYRLCGFTLAARSAHAIRGAFGREIPALPELAHGAAHRVVEAIEDGDRLQPALLDLGSALDRAGAFPAAVGVHLIGYELALLRCDGPAGIDAARSAGRSLRRMGELGGSLRWYRLAARIAEVEEEWGRLALALDGAGNTHRHGGSFPRARRAYEDAWRYALISKDEIAIGNVAQSMMIVEREAGNLESAATFGWTALTHHATLDAKASVLLNLGTLLREGGDLCSAERALRVAHCQADATDLRTLAADALAYCAALRRDAAGYARWRAEVRDADVREPFIRVQLGYFRGLSLAALGHPERAKRVLRAVERYARAWTLAEWEVKAAETEFPLPQSSPMETPAEVRQGLRSLELA